MLLVIATPEGRQIYDRAKAEEAKRGIKTFTRDVVEDYNPEIHQEHDDKKHDEDSAFKRKSLLKGYTCSVLNEATKFFSEPVDKEKICKSHGGCICMIDSYGDCQGCSIANESGLLI